MNQNITKFSCKHCGQHYEISDNDVEYYKNNNFECILCKKQICYIPKEKNNLYVYNNSLKLISPSKTDLKFYDYCKIQENLNKQSICDNNINFCINTVSNKNEFQVMHKTNEHITINGYYYCGTRVYDENIDYDSGDSIEYGDRICSFYHGKSDYNRTEFHFKSLKPNNHNVNKQIKSVIILLIFLTICTIITTVLTCVNSYSAYKMIDKLESIRYYSRYY